MGPCFGILFSRYFLDTNTSSTTTAWIFNTQCFIWNTSGLFARPLTKEFGYRRAGVVASFIASVGFMACAFVPSPYYFFLSFSVFCGIGGGIVTCMCFSIVPLYFLRRRGVANGVMMTGVGVGQIVGPPVTRFLQDKYGYQGATWIIGALMLNAIVAAALFQPVEWHCRPVALTEADMEGGRSLITKKRKEGERMNEGKEGGREEGKKEERKEGRGEQKEESKVQRRRKGKEEEQEEGRGEQKEESKVQRRRKSKEEEQEERRTGRSSTDKEENEMKYVNKNEEEEGAAIGGGGGGQKTITQPNSRNGTMQNPKSTKTDPDTTKSGITGIFKRVAKSTMSDLGVFRSPRASIICLAGALLLNSSLNFIMMVPFLVQDTDHTLDFAAWCLSVKAVCNLVTRIVLSPLSDCAWFSVRGCYVTGFLIVAVVTFAFPLISSPPWMLAAMALYGCGIGANLGLHSLMIIDVMGMDRMPAVYGAGSFTNAVCFICIGPLIGVIRDVSDSYLISMWVLAAMVIVSILLWCFMGLATRYDARKEQERKMKGNKEHLEA